MRVRNVECGMRSSQWKFVWANSPLRTPHSALAVEDRRLFSAPGRSEAKMPERGCRSDAAARGAGEEALLHQERLVHLLERPRVLAHGGADRLQSHGAALELLDDRLQDAGVHVVQSELVHVEPLQRLERHGPRDLEALKRDRKSTRLNSSHSQSRMPSSA